MGLNWRLPIINMTFLFHAENHLALFDPRMNMLITTNTKSVIQKAVGHDGFPSFLMFGETQLSIFFQALSTHFTNEPQITNDAKRLNVSLGARDGPYIHPVFFCWMHLMAAAKGIDEETTGTACIQRMCCACPELIDIATIFREKREFLQCFDPLNACQKLFRLSKCGQTPPFFQFAACMCCSRWKTARSASTRTAGAFKVLPPSPFTPPTHVF